MNSNPVFFLSDFLPMKISFVAILLATAAFVGSSHAQTTITLGETRTLGYSDDGNANLLLADGPYHLPLTAVLNTLHFWVTNAAGELELGIFDSGPNNDCKGGKLR